MEDTEEKIKIIQTNEGSRNIQIAGSTDVRVNIGVDEEYLLEFLNKNILVSMKSANPKIAEDAQKEILMKIYGDNFLESTWMYYLENHIYPLYKSYGKGKGIKIALIGEGFMPLDEITKQSIYLKEVISFVSENSEIALNLVPVTVVNAVAPESEIYYLKGIPGRPSDIIKALSWCKEHQIDIVGILGNLPNLCEDGSCPLCTASKNLVIQNNITVVSPEQGCPKPILEGFIKVGGITYKDQGIVFNIKKNTRFSAKVLALATIQVSNHSTLIISNNRPLIFGTIKDITGDGVSVGNVCGLLALVSSYLKGKKGQALPVVLEQYLKKSAIPLRFSGEIVFNNETKYYGLLEPRNLLERD